MSVVLYLLGLVMAAYAVDYLRAPTWMRLACGLAWPVLALVVLLDGLRQALRWTVQDRVVPWLRRKSGGCHLCWSRATQVCTLPRSRPVVGRVCDACAARVAERLPSATFVPLVRA